MTSGNVSKNHSVALRLRWSAAEGGVGGATLGTDAAVDVAGVAWGATKNAVCDSVGQLSDPLDGHVI